MGLTLFIVRTPLSYFSICIGANVETMAFNGSWRLAKKGDKFGDYLAKIGVGVVKRTVAKNLSRDVIVSNFDATGFDVKSITTLSTKEDRVVLVSTPSASAMTMK